MHEEVLSQFEGLMALVAGERSILFVPLHVYPQRVDVTQFLSTFGALASFFLVLTLARCTTGVVDPEVFFQVV